MSGLTNDLLRCFDKKIKRMSIVQNRVIISRLQDEDACALRQYISLAILTVYYGHECHCLVVEGYR